jgi:hypothetical protein
MDNISAAVLWISEVMLEEINIFKRCTKIKQIRYKKLIHLEIYATRKQGELLRQEVNSCFIFNKSFKMTDSSFI